MASKGKAHWDKKLVGLGGVLNEYVKYRDMTDQDENGKPIAPCITCGTLASGANLQAGHWIRRAIRSTRYDERNLNAQCGGCNRFKNGEPVIYRKRLIEVYGQETVDELEKKMENELKGDYHRWTAAELEELYNSYKIALNNLK